MKKPMVYAHRGASGHAPQNTISAFKMGINMGAKGIETDIQLSADGIPIIIHNDDIDNLSNGTGACNSMTLKELRKYDFGSWFSDKFIGEKIPTLEEVIQLVEKEDIILNIEIKGGFVKYPEIEEKALALVEKYSLVDKVIISSFNHYSIMKIKELNKNIKTAPIYSLGLALPWKYAKMINANNIHPKFTSINKDIVDMCHQNNIQVNCWTPNTKEDIISCINLGVDGIVTNYPDMAIDIINNFI